MNISSLVLVDTSVWIDYFKRKETSFLTTLLNEDLVCINQLILTELIPVLRLRNHNEIIDGLFALSIVPLNINWTGLRLLQNQNYSNGINHVGIPDLMIAQQALDNSLQLWSLDKHYKLMAQVTALRLFEIPNL